MTESIIIALITGTVSLLGSLAAQAKQSNLLLYRIDQLEKKQDKHNCLIERMTVVEQSMKSAHHRLDGIEK